MGKTRDLFKKIRDTKGIFHAKMDSIKDRNDMALREAEMDRRDQGPVAPSAPDFVSIFWLALIPCLLSHQ